MGILNIFDYLIGLLLFPFHHFHPFVGLIWICLIITVVGMIVYKKVTNQEKLKYLQTQIKLILMEMRLRHYTVSELIHLQYKALVWNVRYLKAAFVPSLVIIIPMIMILPSIAARFEYIPARVGTVVSLEVVLANQENLNSGAIKIESIPDGLKLIEADRREGAENVVGWYFRAMKNGIYNLKFSYGDKIFKKLVAVSDEIIPLQTEIKQPRFLDNLYSVERSTLQKRGHVKAVTVLYKKYYSPLGIFGWHPDWLYSFIIIFLLLFFILRLIVKVY